MLHLAVCGELETSPAVRAELVEALLEITQPFDKLRANGMRGTNRLSRANASGTAKEI